MRRSKFRPLNFANILLVLFPLLFQALKEWLGLWDEKRIEQAKRLRLYENKFESKILAKDFIKLGFCGKDLGLKLEKAIFASSKSLISLR